MSWRHSIKTLVLELTRRCSQRDGDAPRDSAHHVMVANTVWRMVMLLYLRAHKEVTLIMTKLPSDPDFSSNSAHGVHGVYSTANVTLMPYRCCYRNADITDSQLDLRSCQRFIKRTSKYQDAVIFTMHDLPPPDTVVVPKHVTILYASDYNAALMSAIAEALSVHLLATEQWSRPSLATALKTMRDDKHTIAFTEDNGVVTQPHYVTHDQLASVINNNVLPVRTP